MDVQASSDQFDSASASAFAFAQAQLGAVDQVMTRLEVSPDGRILDANPRFLRITGYDLADLRGQSHRILLPPDESRAPAYEALWENLRNGQAWEGSSTTATARGGTSGCVADAEGAPSASSNTPST